MPLGRTVGFKANGAVSNLLIGPAGMTRLSRELASGRYDVAHIHEPVAPMVGWVATLPLGVPLVGTFHSYSTKRLAERGLQQLRRHPGAEPAARARGRLGGRQVDR